MTFALEMRIFSGTVESFSTALHAALTTRMTSKLVTLQANSMTYECIYIGASRRVDLCSLVQLRRAPVLASLLLAHHHSLAIFPRPDYRQRFLK